MLEENCRELKWNDIKWRKVLLFHKTHEPNLIKRWKRKSKEKTDFSCFFQESDSMFSIQTLIGLGKVTDAGYDNFAGICTEVSAHNDFCFESTVTVTSFLHEPGPVNQEAFGAFIRDTMKRNPGTGAYYSNMVALGGYYGRFNFFGRSGIEREHIDKVRNFHLYNQVNRINGAFRNSPLYYRITADAPRTFHLTLSRIGSQFFARMIDEQGTDLLNPLCNGGESETESSEIFFDTTHGYGIQLDALHGKKTGKVHIGFLAAGGSDITIQKASVRLVFLGKTKLSPERKSAVSTSREIDDFPKLACDVKTQMKPPVHLWYAASYGTENGKGSREDPLDIDTAIRRCGCNEGVCLCAGTYNLNRSVVIDRESSGTTEGRKFLSGDLDGGRVLLDFGGQGHSLLIQGDYWGVENIQVTNGYGIQIEGNYNNVRNCVAYENLETGILIRHHDNNSSRSQWPCYNRVESCISYSNRDLSECNADGFACKVASGVGNVFEKCISFLNSDDGFDLFTKNRPTGEVTIIKCQGFLNGYKLLENGELAPTGGNGNGFKLGGSGMYVEHQVKDSVAMGNKRDGFTSNSNPYMHLERCDSRNNGRKNISYGYYEGARTKKKCETVNCSEDNDEAFDPYKLTQELLNKVNRIT